MQDYHRPRCDGALDANGLTREGFGRYFRRTVKRILRAMNEIAAAKMAVWIAMF
jgi:hypothetical protein